VGEVAAHQANRLVEELGALGLTLGMRGLRRSREVPRIPSSEAGVSQTRELIVRAQALLAYVLDAGIDVVR
jgi:hypothetical protein